MNPTLDTDSQTPTIWNRLKRVFSLRTTHLLAIKEAKLTTITNAYYGLHMWQDRTNEKGIFHSCHRVGNILFLHLYVPMSFHLGCDSYREKRLKTTSPDSSFQRKYTVYLLGKSIWWEFFDMFFNFSVKHICCGYTLEVPWRGASNEYQERMFYGEIQIIIPG